MVEKCGESPALHQEEQHGVSNVSHPGTRGLIWERDDCACVEVCVSVRTAAGECVCLLVHVCLCLLTKWSCTWGRTRVSLSEVEMFDQLFPFER